MTIPPNQYRGFRCRPAVIEHAVWLYHCFSLSLRDVELILAARGIVVSYESIRERSLRFGRIFANALDVTPEGTVAGTDRRVSITDVAKASFQSGRLPPGL